MFGIPTLGCKTLGWVACPCARRAAGAYLGLMKTVCGLLVCLLLFGRIGLAATKQHVVALGKWTMVKLIVGEDQREALDLKIRALLVDGQTKEFTSRPPHDLTDRTFVVQRVFRMNDSLPQGTVPARWRWEADGCWSPASLARCSRFLCRNSIPILPRSAGFVTMRPIAASPTMARQGGRSLCNSAGESHC